MWKISYTVRLIDGKTEERVETIDGSVDAQIRRIIDHRSAEARSGHPADRN